MSFRIAVLGAECVGKSAVIRRYCANSFREASIIYFKKMRKVRVTLQVHTNCVLLVSGLDMTLIPTLCLTVTVPVPVALGLQPYNRGRA